MRDADATLVLHRGALRGGTALTVALARRLGKPCLTADLAAAPMLAAVLAWLAAQQVAILNVAGPRESHAPGIGEEARALLHRLLGGEAAFASGLRDR